jgi:hypothetical protein
MLGSPPSGGASDSLPLSRLCHWLGGLAEDPLSEHEWAHRIPDSSATVDTESAPQRHAAEAKAAEGATAAPRNVASPTPSGKATGATGAAAIGAAGPSSPGGSCTPGKRQVAFAPLPDLAATDRELAAGAAAAAAASGGKGGGGKGGQPAALPPLPHIAGQLFPARPPPPPSQPDYYALPVGVKAAILSRLCDHLLDCPTIRYAERAVLPGPAAGALPGVPGIVGPGLLWEGLIGLRAAGAGSERPVLRFGHPVGPVFTYCTFLQGLPTAVHCPCCDFYCAGPL